MKGYNTKISELKDKFSNMNLEIDNVKQDQEEQEKFEKMLQQKYKQIKELNNNLNPEKRENLLKMPFSMVSYGSSKGGKSTALANYFKNPDFRVMDRVLPTNIYIISPTLSLDSTMIDLIEFLQERGFDPEQNAFEDVQVGMNTLRDRMKVQKQEKLEKKEIPFIIVVIDDCINCFQEIQPILTELFTIGRHLNISPIVTSQSHKKVNNIIRRNTNIVQIHGLNIQAELDSLSDEYRGPMKKKEMIDLVNRVINSPGYNYLMVMQTRPVQERFIINAEDIVQM